MKVIFLDIDGVLVTFKEVHDKRQSNGMHSFSQECVSRLNKIIDETGAELVLSSSWRIHGLDSFNNHARHQGMSKLPFDVTPNLDSKLESGVYVAKQRGDEIKHWLDRHPEVTHFVAIDDSSDMRGVEDHFVHVKAGMDTGLQDSHVEKAIKLLND